MNKQLETLVGRIGGWPEDGQAEALLELARIERERVDAVPLTPDEREAIAAAMAEVDAGEFASAAEVEALFRRHGA